MGPGNGDVDMKRREVKSGVSTLCTQVGFENVVAAEPLRATAGEEIAEITLERLIADPIALLRASIVDGVVVVWYPIVKTT